MTEINQEIQLLQAPFRANEIQWRKGRVSADGSKAQALPCVSPRSVQARLDEALGAQNWSNRFVEVVADDKLIAIRCALAVYIDGKWVEKEDAAPIEPNEAPSVNSIKAAYADAMKRAAVQWGVARYLYKYPPVWVHLDEHGHFLETPQLPNAFLPAEDHRKPGIAKVKDEPPTDRHAAIVDHALQKASSAKPPAAAPSEESDPVGHVLQGAQPTVPTPSAKAEAHPEPSHSAPEQPVPVPASPAEPVAPSTGGGSLTYEELIKEVSEGQKELIDDLLTKLTKLPAKMIISYVQGPKGMEKLSEKARSFLLAEAKKHEKAND